MAYEEILIDSSKYYETFVEGVSLNVNTLVTNETPEIIKEDEYFIKEAEKIKEEQGNLNEKPEEMDKLFIEELKKMSEV